MTSFHCVARTLSSSTTATLSSVATVLFFFI
nr:MAG TPA: hypothetical protein [Caudoviricetes sp.]